MRIDEEKLKEITVSSEEVFSGRMLHVFNDKIRLLNGHESTRELIRHVGASCVVPVTDDGRVIVERQYRYPFDAVMTEIPAGKLDSKAEDPLEAAKRELREETGYSADHWQDLGAFYPTVAYSDEIIYTYLATGLHKGEQNLDDDEFLNVELVPLKELVEDVMNGKIADGKTQTAILKAARVLGI
ncbi:MAG: NUDIX hydrolase [Lachnospiraceae bacterium]|nr:NUDIX hydrolase [Lachnospiraceae bacterium]